MNGCGWSIEEGMTIDKRISIEVAMIKETQYFDADEIVKHKIMTSMKEKLQTRREIESKKKRYGQDDRLYYNT